MKAIVLSEFGAPEQLQITEVADPVPTEGQVLVAVEFANVTWADTMFRSRGVPPFADLPTVVGNGVGGRIAAVGPGVDDAIVGSRVVSALAGSGGYAELMAVPHENVVPVPDGVDLADATALLADGRTAMMIVEAAGVGPGDRVLVEAAAGGVGSLLVQLVRRAGGRVVAAAGGARKVDIARELGADVVVDYRSEGWIEAVRTAVGELDVVLDGVGGEAATHAAGLLREGGRVVSFGYSSGTDWPELDALVAERALTWQKGVFGSAETTRDFTAQALDLATRGELRPLIGSRLPLEHAAEAHRQKESRQSVGKTLLVV